MNAGRLDRLITFQQNTPTRDNIGGKVDSWADFCQVWANIKNTGGVENTNAERVEAKTIIMFTIRYRTDITNALRISFENAYYNITNIDEVTRKQYLQVTATALTI